jgi:hypothetical protein
MPCIWLWSVTIHLPGGLPAELEERVRKLEEAIDK